MVEYFFDDTTMTLEAKSFGVVKIEDIINHYERIYDDQSLPRKLKVVIDTRNSEFDINLDEMKRFRNIVGSLFPDYTYIKEAIIIDRPFSAAVAIMYERSTDGIKGYAFQVFCTESAAREWLE